MNVLTRVHPRDDSTIEAAPPSRRARRFARIWPLLDESVNELLRPVKEQLFHDLPARVVEIGTGRGANFRYMSSGTAVLGFEPNTLFHEAAREAAAESGVELDLRGHDIRDAGIEPDSVDAVVSTLVLCSVQDPAGALREVERVLRPGGRLLFVEHVGAQSGTATARFQRVFRRPWGALVDGCDTCAATDHLLAQSGFEIASMRRERLGSKLDPTSPSVWGVATKPH